jgi:hypothetical protein
MADGTGVPRSTVTVQEMLHSLSGRMDPEKCTSGEFHPRQLWVGFFARASELVWHIGGGCRWSDSWDGDGMIRTIIEGWLLVGPIAADSARCKLLAIHELNWNAFSGFRYSHGRKPVKSGNLVSGYIPWWQRQMMSPQTLILRKVPETKNHSRVHRWLVVWT